jgi:hypothetical protein
VKSLAGELLDRHQGKVLGALLTYGTIAEAAKAAGVGVRTLRRWLQQPAFAKAYRQARGKVLATAMNALQVAVADAVTALRRQLDNPDVKYQLPGHGVDRGLGLESGGPESAGEAGSGGTAMSQCVMSTRPGITSATARNS